MFLKSTSLLSITTILMFAPAIHATPKMDANGNDEITRIEYMSFRSNAFNKQDKNFDGKITPRELNEASLEGIRKSLKDRFRTMDTNGDGHVTQAEHDDAANFKIAKKRETNTNKWDKWFARVDKDNNGHISRSEFDADFEALIMKANEKSQKSLQEAFSKMDLDGDQIVTESEYLDRGALPGSKASSKSDPMAGLYANESAKPKKRTRRDGNGDGNITKREDREFYEYHFDKHDKNDDGVITKKEARHLFRVDFNLLHIP